MPDEQSAPRKRRRRTPQQSPAPQEAAPLRQTETAETAAPARRESPRRGASKPVVSETVAPRENIQAKPAAKPAAAKPEPPKPLRVAAGSAEPEWVVSSSGIEGAAERRGGTKPAEKAANKSAEKPAGQAAAKKAVKAPSSHRGGRSITLTEAKKAPPVRKKKKKKPAKRRTPVKRILLGAAGAVALVAVLVAGVRGGTQLLDIKRTLDSGENVFYGNLYMNGIPLQGMTLDQAAELVTQQVRNQIGTFSITLHTQDGRSWTITAEDLRMQFNTADQLDQLWSIGHTGTSRERYEQAKALEEEPVSRYTTLTYDLSSVNQILTQIKKEIDVPAVNAQRIDDPEAWPPFAYTDDVPGQTLDITGLNEKITGMVETLTSGTVELEPSPVAPKVTKAALQGEIVKLSSYETAVGATSHEGRFTNIEIGTEKFNHLIIRSGEQVSFNKVTGKRTEANGFVEAPEIAYGEYVMGIGGGICQVSSTLYNAVVNAGLEVVKRTQHSLASNYVPKGQDATVSDDRLDFVFRNSTSAPIYIETQYYKKKNYWYSQFTIYGRPDPNGYSYHLESQIREEIPLPEPTYRPDKNMNYVVYKDQTYQINKGEVGYIVDVYLVTTNVSGLEVSRELAYTDTYKPLAPQFYVGVMERETN